mmetsp:Transcript_24194/g.61288  ORF Transcript_24194/g.61288 Transcript_24194/m.61288 type:complete len:221 (-) Transcript_24194:2662-3324(-)
MSAPCKSSECTCTGGAGASRKAAASSAHERRSESIEHLAARAVCWRSALRRLDGLSSSASTSGEPRSASCSMRCHQPARPTVRATAARIHAAGSGGPSHRSAHALGTVSASSVAPSACVLAVRSSAPRTTRAMDESVPSTASTSAAAFLRSSATKRWTGVSRWTPRTAEAPALASLSRSFCCSCFCHNVSSGESSADHRSRSNAAAPSAAVERVRRLLIT